MEHFANTPWKLKDCVIFLDVDGTLVGEGGEQLEKTTIKLLLELKRHNTLILCSNSPKKERTQVMAKKLGVAYNKGTHKKPSEEILKEFSFPLNKARVVIGNLHCIDGRFAKNIRAKFYPVKTLVASDEGWINRLFYFIDAHLFSKCI